MADTIIIKSPSLILEVQESSSLYDISFEQLIYEALKLYKEERRKDAFFQRIELAEEVSDEENAEIEAKLDEMTEDDLRIVKTEIITV